MLTATQKPEVIREYLVKEYIGGRVLGPLDPLHFLRIQISRFGVIPNRIVREIAPIIMDLLSPEGYSVNDGIDADLCSFKYVTVDHAVAVLSR